MNIFGNSIWQLISQSDKVTWFVLLTLTFLSTFCWTIFLFKIIIWRSKKRQINNALYQIKNSKSFEDILKLKADNSNNIIGYFLSKNLAFLKTIIKSKNINNFNINDRQWDFLQHTANSAIDDILQKEESFLSVESVGAAVSPLLGLFGTVWGLVHAFVDISKKQSADIATVAPGIAEALITTLAGLIVAIPALCMFYYLKLKLNSIEKSLLLFSDKFIWILQSISEPEISSTSNLFNVSQSSNVEFDNV